MEHPNIIECFGAHVDLKEINILMPFMESDLQTALSQFPNKFTPSIIWQFILDISRGLTEMVWNMSGTRVYQKTLNYEN